MKSTSKKHHGKLSMWLVNVISVILLCFSSGCNFKQDPADTMPYKNEHNLTGKMLYERGNYYYLIATTTHFWQGAPETDPNEFRQAGMYYSQALAKGYRPRTGYDHLLEYYDHLGDYTGNFKKQESGYTSLIEAFPDSVKYWHRRAMNRLNYRNYRGALQDLNQTLNTKGYYKGMEDNYYMRGAVKYVLNPKDTTDAETDRITALKLTKRHADLDSYYNYCIILNSDSRPYDKDDPHYDDIFRLQESENTAKIKAYPDSMKYWYYRALDRQQLKNYRGALNDFNKVLKPNGNYKDVNLEDAYYMRGAVKYRLYPKDTAFAEADRLTAIKLHRMNAILISYHDYCNDNWKKGYIIF